ncbi:MAG: TonB-dependent receptor, partial [Thermodesulfovibrionales bacterium]|nr:TonB-dependent receptor [Thermodesulfovibrionales bacterium]
WAEETIKIKEVVVSATKIEEAIEEITSDVIVIKSEDIKNKNVEFVPDVLRNVAELNLVQYGGAGKLASIILRGGSSTHTLVMIDGVKVKSTTTGSFDFSGINVDDIERIEIVKGPQSTLYGSGAMAGVINIITKKGKGKPKIETSFEGGSFGTYKPSVTVSGGDKKIDYRITGTYFYTDGISAAKQGTERDGYKNAALSGKLGFRPTEKLDVEITGKYYYDRSELDDFGKDDLNYIQHGNHYMLSGKGKLYLLNIWEQVLTVSTVKDSLKYRYPDTSRNNSDITTGMNTIDWQHNLYFSERYTFTAGAEYRNEKGENKGVFDKAVDNKALYLNNKLKFLNDDLIINAGLRYGDHETFGSETTYRIGGIYNIKPLVLKVRGSYGTGFRAPTLNELYYQGSLGSGNLNLKPEKSNSWEIGLEKDIVKDKVSISITYFDQNYNDLINWVESPPGSWQYTPQNVAKAEVKGIEASASIKITETLTLKSSYTNLDTEDKETGKRLPMRPKDKLNMTVEYVKGDAAILAGYTFVGEAYDNAANSESKKLASYSLINLSGSYRLTKNIKLFGRIDNLLEEDYETAKGYGVPGFSAFAGVKIEI